MRRGLGMRLLVLAPFEYGSLYEYSYILTIEMEASKWNVELVAAT